MNVLKQLKYYLFFFTLLFYSCKESVNDPRPDDLDYYIGQMLMVGFQGDTLSGSNPIVNDLINNNIGGVVLYDYDVTSKQFDRNIKSPSQLKNLTAQLRSYSQSPLFIAIDQEGGRVNRLKTGYDFPSSVSAQYLGGLNNFDSTRYYANRTASVLSEMGINVNLAPVVDLNINPENPVIGKIGRSFSSDPSVVSAHAEVIIKAHNQKGILTSLKHFPGHGSSESDSHLGFTDVTNTWQSVELEPFKRLIQTGHTDMIMTAHIFNSSLDSVFPATLSQPILTGILRNSLNYEGVIISDDMQMKAVTDHYGLEAALYNTINAGVDIILFSNNSVYEPDITSRAVNIIKKLIKEEKISRERILESYFRINKLKAKLV